MFPMRKLRTMRSSAPGGLASGRSLTSNGDDRVTPTGRVLRRWRLDEVPQLVNVLRGDMLLLGPRPEAPEFVSLEDDRWRAVLSAPPGIAGPTQVLVDRWESEIISGPEGDDQYRKAVLPVKLALDEWYVQRATPALDVLVVWSIVRKLAGRPTSRLRDAALSSVPEVDRIVDD
jgi:lipopolysaccharide/colanic/teichoic acid biosynthesis glycosyltransferase